MKKLILNFLRMALCLALFASCEKNDTYILPVNLPAPDGLEVYMQGGVIYLTWNPVEDAEAYVVYYNVAESSAHTVSNILTVTQFTLSSYEEGTTYEFKVRCANGEAVSEFSEIISYTVPLS